MSERANVGLMTVGLRTYWAQFPGMKENLEAAAGRLADKIGKYANVTSVGMIDSPEAAEEAGRRFIQTHVDLVFCYSSTYCPSDTLVPAVRHLPVPVVILNIQQERKLDLDAVTTIPDWLGVGCTCAGFPELTAMMERYRIRYDVITGFLEGDDETDAALAKWCRAAAVRSYFKKKNIGLLGRAFQGMMDLYIDENAVMDTFGLYTKHLMWEDILRYATEAGNSQMTTAERELADALDMENGIPEADRASIIRMYAGYKRLVEENQLLVLANHFERDMTAEEVDMIAALNPSTAALMKCGTACAVEGDIKGGIGMAIMKVLGGSGNLAELYSMDFDDGICIIGHSGGADPDIADGKIELKAAKVFHGKAGKGYTTQAKVKTGPITLMALKMSAENKLELVCCEGTAEEGKTLQLGDTNCRFRPAHMAMREFVNRWGKQGPTHHGVMGCGHLRDELEAVARIFDIKFVCIDD